MAPLVTMIRFEGAFIIVLTVLLLVGKKQWRLSLAVASLGILPVLVAGAFSQAHNWPLLPSSIILKGNFPDFTSVAHVGTAIGTTILRTAHNFLRVPHVLVIWTFIIVALVIRHVIGYRILERYGPLLILFAGVTLLHMGFADVRWFYRYEAYLVVWGTVTFVYALEEIKVQWSNSRMGRIAGVAVCIAVGIPLVWRAAGSLWRVTRAGLEIYEQQYQMGLFFEKYYSGSGIAVNDIGAVSFLSDCRILDIWGLGSLDVLKSKKAGSWNTGTLERLALSDSVIVAALYSWMEVPPSWVKAGDWRSEKSMLCCGNLVSFYAVNHHKTQLLRDNLMDFSRHLPKQTQLELASP
jgi:hypothetical protein